MASPAYRSSQHSSGTGGDVGVTKPSGLALNDIMLAYVYYENNSAVTVTPPSGFAILSNCSADNTSTNPDHHGRVYWKRAVQADVDAVGFTFSFSPSSAINITLAAWSGCRTGSDPVEDSDNVTGRDDLTLPSVDAATAATTIVGFVASFEWTDTWSSAVMTERADADALAVYDVAQANSGASGTKLIALSANDYGVGAILVLASVAAGTQTPQAVAGAITPSGTAVMRTGKPAAGALTPSGAVVNAASKVLSGVLTPSGIVVNAARKILAGEITPAGVLAAAKIALISLAGELTSSGALVLQAGKTLAGAITPDGSLLRSAAKILSGALTPDGALVRRAAKIFSGEITPTGVVATIKTALISLAGTLAPDGSLARSVSKSLGGALSPDGALSLSVHKILAGEITPSGIVSGVKTALISIGGTLAPTGAVAMRTAKMLVGALVGVGELISQKVTAGGVVAGDLVTWAYTAVSGNITNLAGSKTLKDVIAQIVKNNVT